MLVEDSMIKKVNSISREQEQRILDYLQGAVYCWCKNRKAELFAARDFLGRDNFEWEGTPMFVLYEKSNDVEKAGIDAGWLLKKMINNDKRTFNTEIKGMVRDYRWNGKDKE